MPPAPSQHPPLTSLWDGLSPHLIAAFYEVDRSGRRVDPNVSVEAPLTEATLDATLNWQSPFEQTGAESKAPVLLAMLQAGAFAPVIESLMGAGGKVNAPAAASAQHSSLAFMKQFEGRTGITKLNSTQVFTGMPPVKIQITALFRAWRDAQSEVEAPVEQLWQWSLPRLLAADSTIVSRGVNTAAGSAEALDILMPSKSPPLVALRYKGRIYPPLVIESMSDPINAPVTAKGEYVEKAIPMTLCTLTALDRQDWAKMRLR